MAENTNPLFGKPWADHSVHNTHAEALAVKQEIEGVKLQVKIRRTPEDRFRVRTRSVVVAVVKTTKAQNSAPPKTRTARRKEKAASHKARPAKS